MLFALVVMAGVLHSCQHHHRAEEQTARRGIGLMCVAMTSAGPRRVSRPAGVPRFVIIRILNHSADITSVYDRYSYDAEKRAAMAFWGA